MIRRRLALACLATLATSTLAWAQERRPAFVTVVDRDGQAAAAAKVTCFASPWFAEFDDATDVVEGTTDTAGRVVARVLAQRSYSAFAVVPAADGTFAISPIHEGLVAGGEVALKLDAPRAPQQVHVLGLDAWQHEGPLSVHTVLGVRNRLTVAAVDGVLPPLPGFSGVQVCDANGAVIWSNLASSRDARTGSLDYRDLELTMPPPQPLTVRVTDRRKQPRAGVELWQGQRPGAARPGLAQCAPLPRLAWRRLGTTGADGTATVQVAVVVGGGRVMTNLLVQARAAGRAPGQAGVTAFGPPFSGHDTIATPDGEVLPITIEPEQPLRITPPGAYDVVLFGKATHMVRAISPDDGPLQLHTREDGVAMLPLPRDQYALRVAMVTKAVEAPIWTVVEQSDKDCSIVFNPRAVDLRLRDALGNPPRGAQLVLVPWHRARAGPGYDLPLPIEHTGSVSLRLGGGDWFVWVSDGDAAAWRFIGADEGAVDATLTLAALPRASLRFVDEKGHPQRDLALRCAGSLRWPSINPSNERLFLIYRQMQLGLPQDTPLNWQVTGEDGCLHYRVLPVPDTRVLFQPLLPHVEGSAPQIEVAVGECVDVTVR